ncbi:hypothetical protein Tco_1177975 [Tanacetum coccineum]
MTVGIPGRILSLPSGPDAYDQSLEALLAWPAASKSESRVPDDVSKMRVSAAGSCVGSDLEIGLLCNT